MSLLTSRKTITFSSVFHRYYCTLFALTFSWLFLGVLFENTIYSMNTLAVIFSVMGWLTITVYLYRWMSRAEVMLIQREKRVLAISLLLLFTGQLFLGYLLAVETSWDTEAVYQGAVNLALQGNLGNYRDYFHIFPHNLGATSLLSLVFSAGMTFGVEDLYLLGTTYNVVSLTLGSLLVYGIARELKDVKHGFLALWFSVTCIPLQFYSPIFYTDTLSLPFVAALYYFYLHLLKQDALHKRILIGLCLGIVCALGALIKFSVAIVAVALVVDLIIRQQIWRQRYSLVVALLIFIVLLKSFSAYRDNHILNERYSDLKRIPHTHWVMMGLKGSGAYNGEDYGYTHSYPTYEQRVEATIVRIQERLAAYGLWGYIEFLNRKQQLNFGSGIYGVHEMIDDNPLRRNAVHEFALDGGRYFEHFKVIAQGHHILLFLLIVWGLWFDAVTKSKFAVNIFAARTAVVGIYLFLLLWEANARYIINFIPLFIVCAVYSFPDVYRVLAALRRSLLDALRPLDEHEPA